MRQLAHIVLLLLFQHKMLCSVNGKAEGVREVGFRCRGSPQPTLRTFRRTNVPSFQRRPEPIESHSKNSPKVKPDSTRFPLEGYAPLWSGAEESSPHRVRNYGGVGHTVSGLTYQDPTFAVRSE